MTTTPGIDVSRYQGTIDWAAVAASPQRFAVARATIGDAYTDPRFTANWQGAKDNGLLVSAYHVIKPAIAAAAQIDRFFTSLGGRRSDLPLVMDVELADNQSAADITACIADCLLLVEQRDGRKPLIYTARWFWNPDNVEPRPEWAQFDVWVASYTAAPVLPASWNSWRIWQYSSTGNVPGINAAVDLNWFNGSYEDLLNYTQHVSPPPPTNPGREATVIVPMLNVRNGPGANYDIIDALHAGDSVQVVSMDGSDVWANLAANQWIAMAYQGEQYARSELKPAPQTGLQARVIVDGLNVRSGPGTDFDVVDSRVTNDLVDILDVDGRDVWGRIAPNKWAAIAFRGQRLMQLT
jgi:lysozyme